MPREIKQPLSCHAAGSKWLQREERQSKDFTFNSPRPTATMKNSVFLINCAYFFNRLKHRGCLKVVSYHLLLVPVWSRELSGHSSDVFNSSWSDSLSQAFLSIISKFLNAMEARKRPQLPAKASIPPSSPLQWQNTLRWEVLCIFNTLSHLRS